MLSHTPKYNGSPQEITELKNSIFKKAISLSEISYSFLTQAMDAVTHLNEPWEQEVGLRLISSMLDQPPKFDAGAYNRLMFSLQTKETQSNHKEGNYRRFLFQSQNQVLAVLDKFLLQQMGLNNEFNQYKLHLQFLANLPEQGESESKLKLNRSAKNFAIFVAQGVECLRPELLYPNNALDYVDELKETNKFLKDLNLAVSDPLLSYLQNPSLDLPGALARDNASQNNLSKAHLELNAERKRIALEAYANTDYFLKLKEQLNNLIKEHSLQTSQFGKYFYAFLEDPSEVNLKALENAAHYEGKIVNGSIKKVMSSFVKEAKEVAFLHACDLLQRSIDAKSESDPMREAGLQCLHDLKKAKQNGADTAFLLDKANVITNTMNNPKSEHHRNQLLEKTQEVVRSGLKILGASMLCLFSAAVLVGSIYLTVQLGGTIAPVTALTSKFALAMMGLGIAVATASTYSLYKSAHYFFSAIKTPELKKSMTALENQAEKSVVTPVRA